MITEADAAGPKRLRQIPVKLLHRVVEHLVGTGKQDGGLALLDHRLPGQQSHGTRVPFSRRARRRRGRGGRDPRGRI